MKNVNKIPAPVIALVGIVLAAASAVPARAKAEAEPPIVADAHATFAAACDKAAVRIRGGRQGTASTSWFVNGKSSRISNWSKAVQEREEALKTGRDRLTLEISQFKTQLTRVEDFFNRQPSYPSAGLDVECVGKYIAFLQSADAPSWDAARRSAAQASAAKVEQQRQDRDAAQQSRDAAYAETARQQKEAAVATAQAGEQAAQRAVQQQARAAILQEGQRLARDEVAKAGEEAAVEAKRQTEPLPTCTGDVVLGMVKDTIAASPAGHVLGLRIVDFDNPRETGVTVSPPMRHCFTGMITTAGRNWGPYTVQWASGGRDHILVELQLQK